VHAVSDLASEISLAETLDRFEKCSATFAQYLKKARDRVARSKKALTGQPGTKELAKLIAELREMTGEPPKPDIAALVDGLDAKLSELRHGLLRDFADQLRNACSSERLPFRTLGDGFGVSAFLLTLDAAQGTASFWYGKAAVTKDVPLDARRCVSEAIKLKDEILDEPVDLQRTRSRFEEAIRVALARRNRPIKGELRAELPQVFREVGIIRQLEQRSSVKAMRGYGLPRFVVELSRLVQSEDNIESKRQLRLETAVLENTKDPKRSVFIPKDLASGFGEGTFYQAVILRGE
jgi:hypothetical protein